MFRLTREVRFAINDPPDDGQFRRAPANSYAGYPSLAAGGIYLALQVTLEGPLDPASGYLRNIREIDQAVRQRIIAPMMTAMTEANPSAPTAASASLLAPQRIFTELRDAFPGSTLRAVSLLLSPFLATSQLASEFGMYTRLSQKFEFSAAHRLHNPALSDEQNRAAYGKCNNPSGHGHNYEVQVTLRGRPNDSGLLIDVPEFERIVKSQAIDRLDHRHLNLDVPEFRELVPTVENIAKVIYRMLRPHLGAAGVELASVTVWETPKTWCEYTELEPAAGTAAAGPMETADSGA